eukprot:COSAG06_NODE_9448_length_1900_cov_28.085047_1_plen_119_part_00
MAWKASYRGGNFESGGVKVDANEYQFLGLVAINSNSKQLSHLSNTFKEFERKFKDVKGYEPVWFFGGGKLDPAKVKSSLAPKAVKGWFKKQGGAHHCNVATLVGNHHVCNECAEKWLD